jgi:hypothetical protein
LHKIFLLFKRYSKRRYFDFSFRGKRLLLTPSRNQHFKLLLLSNDKLEVDQMDVASQVKRDDRPSR